MRIPAELLRPFRPRAARWVAWTLLVATVLAAPTLFVVMDRSDLAMSGGDVIGTVLTAVALIWLCYRQATVSAVPSDSGLTVRNFIRVRRLEWAQVVGVRFGPNNPWAQLDLSDGTTLAVMAIQSSDGEYARRQSGRLAALVQIHEAPESG